MVSQSSQTNRIPFALEDVFLQLDQPIDETHYTVKQISPSTMVYEIPFLFTVPAGVKDRPCAQPGGKTHTALPPTLGDPRITRGKGMKNDMMPNSGQVSYQLNASALVYSSPSRRNSAMLTATEPLCVVPAGDRQTGDTSILCQNVSNKACVTRGTLRRAAGEMHIFSESPKPIQAPRRGSLSDEYGSTSVAVNIEFHPTADSDLPPYLDTLGSKLVSHTSLGVPPSQLHCGLSTACFDRVHRCHYTDATKLPKIDVRSLQWSRRVTNHHDHGMTRVYYAARVIVPIVLPKTKVFVSDFQSCVVSRSYSADLSLSYRATGTSFTTSSIYLQVPVSVEERVN